MCKSALQLVVARRSRRGRHTRRQLIKHDKGGNPRSGWGAREFHHRINFLQRDRQSQFHSLVVSGICDTINHKTPTRQGFTAFSAQRINARLPRYGALSAAQIELRCNALDENVRLSNFPSSSSPLFRCNCVRQKHTNRRRIRAFPSTNGISLPAFCIQSRNFSVVCQYFHKINFPSNTGIGLVYAVALLTWSNGICRHQYQKCFGSPEAKCDKIADLLGGVVMNEFKYPQGSRNDCTISFLKIDDLAWTIGWPVLRAIGWKSSALLDMTHHSIDSYKSNYCRIRFTSFEWSIHQALAFSCH